ncbi:MAG TPA: bifunctional DNA-formamidopyrimidine glycosylase/DNA-(apurinic or apyrimidinic site) lyase [Thermomicrobiales bacterium]|jgi:formamidopyrimidine-DNA glycosylase
MPELPEVETVRRGLAAQIVGRVFTGISFLEWPRTIESPAPEELAHRIAGRRVLAVGRRAKFLVIALAGGESLIVHLRMTGQLTVAPQASPRDRFARVALGFADGDELRFSDIRRFGRIGLYDEAGLAHRFRDLGPEPLDDRWLPEAFAVALARRRTRLKPLLLDQSFVAGLGNIYADEALFRAGLHPLMIAAEVSPERAALLHASIRELLDDAINSGGTTFSNYRDAYGNEGDYYERRRVYARTDAPCLVCGAPIVRIVVGGRGTHFCAVCQPAPGSPLGQIVPFPSRVADRLVAEDRAPYIVVAPEGEDGR